MHSTEKDLRRQCSSGHGTLVNEALAEIVGIWQNISITYLVNLLKHEKTNLDHSTIVRHVVCEVQKCKTSIAGALRDTASSILTFGLRHADHHPQEKQKRDYYFFYHETYGEHIKRINQLNENNPCHKNLYIENIGQILCRLEKDIAPRLTELANLIEHKQADFCNRDIAAHIVQLLTELETHITDHLQDIEYYLNMRALKIEDNDISANGDEYFIFVRTIEEEVIECFPDETKSEDE